MDIKGGHDCDAHNAFFSEGGALAVVVEDFHETPHQTRDSRNLRRPLQERRSEAAPRGSPLARRNGAPHERGAGGESDPPILAAGAARGRAKVDRGRDTLCLPFLGVALTTVIPGGLYREVM